MDYGSCRNCNSLNADELKTLRRNSLDLETQLDRFTNAFHDFIQRPGLRMAPRQLRDGCDVKTLLVPLDHDVKLALHIGLPPSMVDESTQFMGTKLFSPSQSYTCHFPSPALPASMAYREASGVRCALSSESRIDKTREF